MKIKSIFFIVALAISACSDENNSNNDKSSGDKSETLDPVSGFYTDTLTPVSYTHLTLPTTPYV